MKYRLELLKRYRKENNKVTYYWLACSSDHKFHKSYKLRILKEVLDLEGTEIPKDVLKNYDRMFESDTLYDDTLENTANAWAILDAIKMIAESKPNIETHTSVLEPMIVRWYDGKFYFRPHLVAKYFKEDALVTDSSELISELGIKNKDRALKALVPYCYNFFNKINQWDCYDTPEERETAIRDYYDTFGLLMTDVRQLLDLEKQEELLNRNYPIFE